MSHQPATSCDNEEGLVRARRVYSQPTQEFADDTVGHLANQRCAQGVEVLSVPSGQRLLQ